MHHHPGLLWPHLLSHDKAIYQRPPMNVSFYSFRFHSLCAMHIFFTRKVKSAAPFITHIDMETQTLVWQLILPKCCMRAGDILDALHQERIHCTANLEAPDFSHLNFSASVPLMLSLLHASSVPVELDKAFFLIAWETHFATRGW